MCLEKMDLKALSLETDRLRKSTKSRSRLRVTSKKRTTSKEGPTKTDETGAKTTIPKYLRRKQKRIQLSNIVKVLGSLEQEENLSRCDAIEYQKVTVEPRCLLGAMAPENTTQYLMANVYDDLFPRLYNQTIPEPVSAEVLPNLYDWSLSPNSVYAALDSVNDNCLAFQQRNFEELFSFFS